MSIIHAFQVQEKIEQGTAAILKAQGEGKDTSNWMDYFAGLENQLMGLLNAIPEIGLSEFEKQDFSIEIFSTVPNRTVWSCPDKEAAAQVKRDDTEAVCHTPDELRNLIAFNPGPESLKTIHEGKAVLSGTLIDHKNKLFRSGKLI